METLKDAENQTTGYTYDDAGGKLAEEYPDHTGGSPGDSSYGIVSFVLDAAGRTLRKQDQNGDTVTFTYDLAGRMTQRDYRTRANSPSGTIADSDVFTFDRAGRMLTAISGRYSNTVTYTYNTAGQKSTEALTISGQTYTVTSEYNSRGELTKYTYPDGAVVERLYTDRGELHQLKHAGTTIDTRTYDDGGRMTGSSYNNGVSESRSYNNDNTLASISFSGASIGNMSYSWDANKNKTAESISGTMSGYGFSIPSGGYDAEDRLVEYNRTSGLDQSWDLSLVGDWNSITTNTVAQNRTHGPTHELLTVASQTVTHDVKGNMTLIPAAARANAQALALSWDFDNRMTGADVGNNSTIDVSHQYDALGRRVARTESSTTTVFVQSGQQTIADYAAGAAPASSTFRYVYASYIDEPVMRWQTSNSARVYYHRNQQYSIIALTDDSGGIIERYCYSAYGDPTFFNGSGSQISESAISNRYTYTGREWDGAIRLYHYRARMYDPQLGRFLGRDPIGYVDGYNNYENYFGLEKMDPYGLCQICGMGPLIYFQSWCVNCDQWRAFEDEAYDNFSKYLECEIEIHKKVWVWVADASAAGGAIFCSDAPVCKKSPELLQKGLGSTVEKRTHVSLLSKWEYYLRQNGWLKRGNILRGHMNSVKRFPKPTACGTAVAAVAMVEMSVSWYCSFKATL